MAIAALDGDRGHPAEPAFRRVGPVARDLRPKNGSRLALLPVSALVVILVALAGITHALIGVCSVVLDYVHTRTRSW
jgi:hypothetical protein